MIELSYDKEMLEDELEELIGKYDTKLLISEMISFAIDIALAEQEDTNIELSIKLREIEEKLKMN
ncbi:MAG: hypothetical protein FWF07_00295 [Methanomassiliicoccaceae archaeon]|nr:hypothetical protein [Methanomassiliicoccaceae archaeon]